MDARGKQKVVHHDRLKPYVGELGLPWAHSALNVNKTKAKWEPQAWKPVMVKEVLKHLLVSPAGWPTSAAHVIMPVSCIIICVPMFKEKDVPFEHRVYEIHMVTQGTFHTHHKKNHQAWVDQSMGSRVSMFSQDFMPRHFVQVCIAEVEAVISPDIPAYKEVRANALQFPGDKVDQCWSQQDIMDQQRQAGHWFPPSGEKLSRWMAQLENEMKRKDQRISELRGTVDELAHAVAKGEWCAQRCKAKSDDQAWWYNEEWERLCAGVAALEAELVACGSPPLKPISALLRTPGYQP